jgi:tRNA A-37 threonylcarbamoyl transferase component Bud32
VSDQERLEIGQPFGRYQIVRVLGEGGMGVVYEALHLGLKKRFAIKTLRAAIARIPEAQVRFLREGEAAARIHHPHVVNVVDVGTEGETPFLVMEYLEGGSLADLMFGVGRMDVAPALALLLPAMSAVAAGHALGVVHRDLKPANIFIARGPWGESVPKVLDFGVSKLLAASDGSTLTATSSVVGTAAYMSPEQAKGGKEVDGRSDQFALGLILYEMLTGVRAHAGDNQFEVVHNIATGKLTRPRERRPELPVAIEEILLKMLAFAPADRFASLFLAGRALMPFADAKVRTALANAFADPAEATVGATPALPAPAAVPRGNTTTFQKNAAEMAANGSAGIGSKRRGKIAFAFIAGVGIAGSVALGLSRRSASRAPTAIPVPVAAAASTDPPRAPPSAAPAKPEPAGVDVDVRVIPAEADIGLDNRAIVRGHLRTTLSASDHQVHVLHVSAPGYRSKELSFGPGAPPPPQIALEAIPPPAAAAKHGKRHATVRAAPHPVAGSSRPPPPPPDATPAPGRGPNDALIIH